MVTPLSWIKAFVPDLKCTDQEYTDRMTLTGTKVEGFERLDRNLEKIVVGKVVSIEKHPDADKLVVCQVDIGTQTIQIVTGAPNVKVGECYPTVLDGGRVAGGHDGGAMPENGIPINAGKLRGVESNGMMCSIEELGSSREVFPDAPENGLYPLPADSRPGDDAIEVLGLHDTVFDYEITSNRVDCYSIMGVAREAAATFDNKFVYPEVKKTGNSEKASDYISVDVEASDLCTRYIGRVVKNIRLGESPDWMKKRLRACGIRPINNLVDITNYVMVEYGQPMHAYDLSTIAGKKIAVRRAHNGDVFTTLDGEARKLDENVLMICDGEKQIGIAGIMGGDNSKITDDVHDVLFEAATFNGTNIRKSAKRIGLRTEASGIFEKGLDPNNAYEAMERACSLAEELSCGEVVGGRVDVYDSLPEPVRIEFEPERINKYLGTDIPDADMLEYFKKIEIEYDEESNELVCPTFRQDLKGFADTSEEVARFYGYDRIPVTLPNDTASMGKIPFKIRVENVAMDIAEFSGYSQGYCYSFESPAVFDKLMLPADAPERKCITISNPLGVEFSIMRTMPLNGMLTSLSTNFNRRNADVKLYELGNIYLPHELPLKDLPDERKQFTLGFYGSGDFYTLKGVVEEFLVKVGMKKKPVYDPKSGRPYLHPGRQADIIYDGEKIGYLGQIHPQAAANYDMAKAAVYVAVIDMPKIVEKATFDRKFEGIAKFPAVSRDISMVVPSDLLAGQIEEIISQRGGRILENYSLFDIYEGDQIKQGFKSMAYTITFRNKEKTLADDEVNAAMKKILNGLEGLGIELRS